MKAVGVYLQECRDAAGLTQEQVAKELGVVARTVSDWEAGRYSPSFERMARLVRFIKADIAEVASRLLDTPPEKDARQRFTEVAETLTDDELPRATEAIRRLRTNGRRKRGGS